MAASWSQGQRSGKRPAAAVGACLARNTIDFTMSAGGTRGGAGPGGGLALVLSPAPELMKSEGLTLARACTMAQKGSQGPRKAGPYDGWMPKIDGPPTLFIQRRH